MSRSNLCAIDAAGNFIDNVKSLMARVLVALAPVAVPSLRVPGLPVPVGTGRPHHSDRLSVFLLFQPANERQEAFEVFFNQR
jgi:hypothetical protein